MKTANDRCLYCNHCKALFRKGGNGFWRNDQHYCLRHEKIVDKTNACDDWQKRELCYNVSVQRIDEVIKDVEWLLNYFSEK